MSFVPDHAGVLVHEDSGTLVVADLHLEKASWAARRGMLLPPHDSRDTLVRLAAAVRRLDPATVVCLGDSFHDADGSGRLDRDCLGLLRDLQSGRTWIWIAGNHDPGPTRLDGDHAAEVTVGEALLRHEPSRSPARLEIAGHLHPAVTVRMRGGRVRSRCFASDDRRWVLPAFGSLAGGLDVDSDPFRDLFPRGAAIHALGRERIYRVR